MRRVPLKLVPPADHSQEPGYKAWKSPTWGKCAVCSRPGRLVRHHVISEAHVRQAGGDPYDPRNALELGMYCRCHRDHHQAARRIPASRVPAEALEFAIKLLGAGPADLYIERYYAPW